MNSKLADVGLTIFSQMSQLAQQQGAINLSQGFPDFPAPLALKEALARNTLADANQYAPMTGMPQLREQVAGLVQRHYGRQLCAEQEITITPGATQAIFCAIQALVQPGDEVIVFDPCYDSYEPAVRLAGGRTLHVPLDAQFRYNWQAFAAALSVRTRLVIINSPHNPSGALLSREDLDQLAQLTEQQGIYILSDEVYEHLVLDGHQHHSVLAHDQLYARACVVSSFGKSFHVTGWKTGYLVAPPQLSAEVRKVHQFVSYCVPTPLQLALADFMQQHPEHLLELSGFYQAKRDLLCAGLEQSLFSFTPSPGTYFQLVDYRAIRDDADDMAVARWLTEEHKVAAIPLSVFYHQPPADNRWLRLCFAKQDSTLQQALERLCQVGR